MLILGLYFGLGSSLPYHSSYSIVEILFLGLIICTSIFGCLSMTHRYQDDSKQSEPKPIVESTALILSGAVLLALPRFGLNPLLLEEWQYSLASRGTPYLDALYAAVILLLVTPGLMGISRVSLKLAFRSTVAIALFEAVMFVTDQPGYYLIALFAIVGSNIYLEHRKRKK